MSGIHTNTYAGGNIQKNGFIQYTYGLEKLESNEKIINVAPSRRKYSINAY